MYNSSIFNIEHFSKDIWLFKYIYLIYICMCIYISVLGHFLCSAILYNIYNQDIGNMIEREGGVLEFNFSICKNGHLGKYFFKENNIFDPSFNHIKTILHSYRNQSID